MKNKIHLFTLAHSFLISFGFALSVQASAFALGYKAGATINVAQKQTFQHVNLKTKFLLENVDLSNSFSVLNSSKIKQSTGKPPAKGTPSDASNGLGTRGECLPESGPQALAPRGIGAAMTESATQLYFFIPQAVTDSGEENMDEMQSLTDSDPATFSLTNRLTGEILYEKELEVLAPTLLRLDFAQAESPVVFEPGQTYQWQFTLKCDRTEMVPEYPSVFGYLRQVPLDSSLIEEGNILDLADRPLYFAEMGLQYEAIAALIELIQTEPDNPEIEAIWQELLPEISLDVVKPALVQTSEE